MFIPLHTERHIEEATTDVARQFIELKSVEKKTRFLK